MAARKMREYHDQMVAMRAAGISYGAISKELDINLNSVKSWCQRNNLGKSITQVEKHLPVGFGVRMLVIDEDTEVYPDFGNIEVLELPPQRTRRIFTVCGRIEFRGKFDAFVSKIPNEFEHKLSCGDLFVFCSQNRRQLSILQWQNNELTLMFRRTEKVRYPWHQTDEMTVIEITESDFRMLMEFPQFMLRLSGETTQQIIV